MNSVLRFEFEPDKPDRAVYHVLNRSVAGLPMFRKRADYEAFERIRTCIARSHPYGRSCTTNLKHRELFDNVFRQRQR
jgi:hypothetical protein